MSLTSGGSPKGDLTSKAGAVREEAGVATESTHLVRPGLVSRVPPLIPGSDFQARTAAPGGDLTDDSRRDRAQGLLSPYLTHEHSLKD